MILEQDAINALIKERERIELAESARHKLSLMYLDIVLIPCLEDMLTLKSIGNVIDDISHVITESNVYYNNFTQLRLAYQSKLLGI